MSFTEALELAHRESINLSWLVKLRWASIAGQLVTIGVVQGVMGIHLPLAPLLGLLGFGLATNIVMSMLASRAQSASPRAIPAVMVFDTLLFTGLLYWTGGPFNPFSFLYLVQIALAAIVLRERWTWALVVLSLVCSAFLFIDSRPLPLPGSSHADHMRVHLFGMWVAFGVAAGFIVYFLMRITRALARRDAELDEARQLATRQEKLASLATLAAGTAHELATPLSTIAVVAGELDRALADSTKLDTARADVQLIRREVQRCRTILDGMSVRDDDPAGERSELVELAAVLRAAVSELPSGPPIRLDLHPATDGCKLEAPPKALVITLQNLLKNAQDASALEQEVVLSAQLDGNRLRLEVRDRGAGMAPEILRRIGEPFFTTKPPGQGMGLGVFVSRAMIERLGGKLSVNSEPQAGTRVVIDLPFDRATTCRTMPAT
jgi:two-component system, sensor histidine kinase RegB